MIEFSEFERAKGNGQYETMVPLTEAQAEIARLQTEVEALKTARDMLGRFWDKAKQEADTAWNDALEAAALRIEGRDWFLEDGIESTPSEDIRALKRTPVTNPVTPT